MPEIASIVKFVMDIIVSPFIVAATNFWSSIIVPFWNNVCAWFQNSVPFVESFEDFCMNIFKFRYGLRVASFGVMLIIVLISVPVFLILSRKRRKTKR